MMEVKPVDHCDAVITIPGSKSYTHRALMISALAEGESILIHPSQNDDTEQTIQGLNYFGIHTSQKIDGLHVFGRGGRLEGGDEDIFVGNSGSSMRFLAALSALRNGSTQLDGDERMRERPIGDLLSGLRQLGVEAYSKEREGFPPVMIKSHGLKGGKARIRGEESSQYLSGLLMIAPYAQEDVYLEVTGSLVSSPYIDVTLDVMSGFGVKVEREGYRSFLVRAGQRYQPRWYQIEGDASNASFFFAAAAITNGKIKVVNYNPYSVQGDVRFLDILEGMGCEIIRGEDWAEVRGRDLHGIDIDMGETPDLVPTLSVTAAFARGETWIRRIGHLRLKESDRIKAITVGLRSMGIQVREGEDWLRIKGGGAHGAAIEPFGDHRIAMSFAIAGLVVPGIKIQEEQCVNKSFPEFWERLKQLH